MVPRWRQEGAKRSAGGASWRSFSPLGATLGRLGSTFMGDLAANRFFIDFSTMFYRFWDGFGRRFGDVFRRMSVYFLALVRFMKMSISYCILQCFVDVGLPSTKCS